MHAGGVAESAAPWNDEKDPFEVLFSSLLFSSLLSLEHQREDCFDPINSVGISEQSIARQ